jgi:hypothetical protein
MTTPLPATTLATHEVVSMTTEAATVVATDNDDDGA